MSSKQRPPLAQRVFGPVWGSKKLGTCCAVVPLRAGIACIAVITLVASILSFVSICLEQPRLLSGGYSDVTRVMTSLLGFTGILCSLVGIVGTYDNSANYVRVLWLFTVVRLFIELAVLGMDLYTLGECPGWTASITSRMDYNPTMDSLHRREACHSDRAWYIVLWTLDVWVSFYFSWVLWQYTVTLKHGLGGVMPSVLRPMPRDDMPRAPQSLPVGPTNQPVVEERRPLLAGAPAMYQQPMMQPAMQQPIMQPAMQQPMTQPVSQPMMQAVSQAVLQPMTAAPQQWVPQPQPLQLPLPPLNSGMVVLQGGNVPPVVRSQSVSSVGSHSPMSPMVGGAPLDSTFVPVPMPAQAFAPQSIHVADPMSPLGSRSPSPGW